MKVTPTVLKVLAAVAECPNGCGARHIAKAMGIYCGRPTGLVAGGYAGRLVRQGWLLRTDDFYINSRGGSTFMGVIYELTRQGRKLLSKGVKK